MEYEHTKIQGALIIGGKLTFRDNAEVRDCVFLGNRETDFLGRLKFFFTSIPYLWRQVMEVKHKWE